MATKMMVSGSDDGQILIWDWEGVMVQALAHGQVRNHLNYRMVHFIHYGQLELGADSSGLLHGYQRVRIILTRN